MISLINTMISHTFWLFKMLKIKKGKKTLDFFFALWYYVLAFDYTQSLWVGVTAVKLRQ